MYFPNYGLRKRWLDKCLKSDVSEDPSTSNMEDGPKHCSNVQDGAFTIFINLCEKIQLEKVYISAIQNLKTVC